MLAVRIAQPAFHPDAKQTVLETDHKSLIALTRTSLDGAQKILVLVNIGEEPVGIELNSRFFQGNRLVRQRAMAV